MSESTFLVMSKGIDPRQLYEEIKSIALAEDSQESEWYEPEYIKEYGDNCFALCGVKWYDKDSNLSQWSSYYNRTIRCYRRGDDLDDEELLEYRKGQIYVYKHQPLVKVWADVEF